MGAKSQRTGNLRDTHNRKNVGIVHETTAAKAIPMRWPPDDDRAVEVFLRKQNDQTNKIARIRLAAQGGTTLDLLDNKVWRDLSTTTT